jgi:hypothetical protein
MQFFGLEPPPHDAPGPFSLANPDRLRSVLSGAGFKNIEITPENRTLKLAVGQSIDDWARDRLLMGLTGQIYKDSDSKVQGQARQFLATSVEPYHVEDGLEMSGATWIVTARS